MLVFIAMENEIICGVYKITNTINNKFYIGSSRNIDGRWKVHKKELRADVHCNQHLQYAWKKYGEDNFTFEVLHKYKKPYWAGKKEQLYLNEHVGTKKCYNINKCVCWISEGQRRKLSEANKDKMTEEKVKHHSIKMKKYWSSDRSDEHRQQITDSLRITYKSENMRKKLSDTVKQSHIDKPRSEESRLKNSESNKKAGIERWERDREKILTDEFRQKLSGIAKERFKDVKVRKKLSDQAKQRYADPKRKAEIVAKMLETKKRNEENKSS